MNKRARPSRGMATAFVLMLLFVFSVLGFAFGSRGTMVLSQVYASRQYMLAYYAAQAGIMTAIEAEQQSDANIPAACGGIVSSDATLPNGATRLASLQTLSLPYTLANNAQYSITITNNTALPTNCSVNATAPDGTLVPPGSVYITSKGIAQGRTKVSNVMVPVTPGTAGSPPVYFNYGTFAQTTINFNNNVLVDSYNSSYGSYNCTCGDPGCTCSSGQNQGSNGSVGTNSSANSAVSLSNNVTVQGPISVGPGGTAGSPTISASGGASYISAAVLSTTVSFPTVTDPVAGWPGSTNLSCTSGATCSLTANTPYNNVSVSNGATLNVGCGNYSMSSINLGNNAIININCNSGSAKFYLHGGASVTSPLNFGNNTTVNTTGAPSAFQIYDLSSATGCSGSRCTDYLSNNTQMNVAFYAPNSNISVANNGAIYGSLISYSVTATNNAPLHYDQALSTVQIGNGTAPTPATVGNFTTWNFQ